MTLFDKSKPYGTIRGIVPDGAKYTQGGLRFDNKYNLCVGDKPAPTPKVPEKIETETPELTLVSDEPSVDYESMHHMVLKKLVKEAGGEYTDKLSAIEFLQAQG